MTWPVSRVAKKLRGDLVDQGSVEAVAATTQRLRRVQVHGKKQALVFDKLALTFIISSWVFEKGWEDAVIGVSEQEPFLPVRFEHGALTPVAAVFTPKTGRGGEICACTSPAHATSGPRPALAILPPLFPLPSLFKAHCPSDIYCVRKA